MSAPINPSVFSIYLKMLEYGNECFTCGITFKKIKQRLINDGLFVQGDPEQPLLLLFEMAFYHLHETCVDPNKPKQECDCNDSYNHLDNCPHFFSKEGCMDLVKLTESTKNELAAKENQNAALLNLQAAMKSLRIGWIALGIAALGAIFQIAEYITPTDPSEVRELQKIELKQDSLNALLLSEFSKFQYESDKTHNKDSLFLDFVGKTSSYLNQNKPKGAPQQAKGSVVSRDSSNTK